MISRAWRRQHALDGDDWLREAEEALRDADQYDTLRYARAQSFAAIAQAHYAAARVKDEHVKVSITGLAAEQR